MYLKTGHLLKRAEYRVERVLGQGGFGITYLCEQTGLLRKVAVKEFFMKGLCGRDADTSQVTLLSVSSRDMVNRFRSKFIKEARTIAAFNHKHIVRIIDVFEDNNTAYYVMEYVDGGSLADKVNDGALAEVDALRYIKQTAEALEYLHRQNRLHLDIKPQNIMVDNDGQVVLIDFGVSKQYDEVGNANTVTVMGYTPCYAPLEQCNQGIMEFTPSTDIYSLGAVLFKLVTGQTPPNASEVYENGLPALPQNLSAPVCAAIKAAMLPRRRDRPQNISEFLAILDGASGRQRAKRVKAKDELAVDVSKNGKADGERGVSWSNGKEYNSRDNRERSKRPFNTNLFVFISVAAICIIATLFGVKSCYEQAEQQRVEEVRKAKEEAERLATQARIQEIMAEKKRAEEAERKAKEEAERLATQARILEMMAEKKRAEEAERIAKEEAELKVKEEAERKSRNEYAKTRGSINGHEWVDLGLSVKWATCNVGASYPADYGDYYAWGETYTKGSYDSKNSVTYGKQMSNIAGNSIYDVARKKWGGSWRLPTNSEFQELRDDCIWTWTTQSGNKGYKVTSNKNGNSIFLPAAGWCYGSLFYRQGYDGYYWSSIPCYDNESNGAYCFRLRKKGVDWNNRYGGQSVRPVCK